MTAPHPTQEDTARIHAVEDEEPAAAAAAPGGVPGGGRRRAARIAGAAMTAAALAAVAVHLYLTRGDESTDAAQVEADVVPIAPRVAGAVLRVHVNDNQLVEKGDLLLEIDPADHAARVRQAEADLATAGAQAAAADAQILVARAAVARAEADGRKGSADLARARRLRAADALPQAQLDTVQAAGDSADAGIAAARAQLAAARASAELAHARARGAEAALELARLQLSYTKVLAPRDGELSRLAAREGQLVAAAQPVAQLVPLETYLVANFKETQIGAMAPGQMAEIEIDGYGGTKLEGRVESISGGTGARFSLLPPDNASGNFVKVTERVPVRIAWVKVPEGIRLRAGLSAEVTVHTR